MPKTPAEMIEAVLRNLPRNTGKTHAEWKAIAKKGPKDPKELYRWLKAEHACGHVAALILSGQLVPYEAPEKLVEAQYAGKNAGLLPIYQALVRAAKKLGKDVEPKPCKTYVPLHRSKTFAIIKPGAGRVDLGLVLPGVEAGGRLKKTKKLGSDRITHQVALTAPSQVDAQVARWLEAAYEQA